MVDIYRTRRGHFHRCLYWKRNEKGVMDNDKLIHNTKPNGVFYAKIVSNKDKGENNVAGVFRVPFTNITIETQDKVNIDVDDLILMDGKKYIVDRAPIEPVEKNSEFSKSVSSATIITMKGE